METTPGFAQYALEERYPGAMALFVMGCGADANPNPRSTLELAERHGKTLAEAVSQVLSKPLQPVQGGLKTRLEFVKLPLVVPTREEFQTRTQDKDIYRQRHARYMLQLLEKQGKIPASYSYPIQVTQLGKDLTLVALAGEVVVDYAIRFRKELKGKTLWPIGYANDVFAYIPSVRILREGGYEALGSGNLLRNPRSVCGAGGRVDRWQSEGDGFKSSEAVRVQSIFPRVSDPLFVSPLCVRKGESKTVPLAIKGYRNCPGRALSISATRTAISRPWR